MATLSQVDRNDVLDVRINMDDADRRVYRSKVAAGAVLAPLTLWLLFEVVLGVDLRAPVFDGSSSSSDVGAAQVVMASASASLAGWLVLGLLERFSSRAAGVWVFVATVVLLLSLGSPFGGSGITVENSFLLATLHLAVAAVLIPGLYRSARARSANVVSSN